MGKRVLIISNNALSFSANNGRTLNSFFSDYDGEKLAQLFFNSEIPQSKVVKRFFNVRAFDQLRQLFFKGAEAGSEVTSFINYVGAAASGSVSGSVKVRLIGFLNSYLESLKLYLRDLGYKCGLQKNKRLMSWVEAFSPQCIFFVAGNCKFSIDYALFLSTRLGIPLYTYITDDYVISNYPVGPFGKVYHRGLHSRYAELLRHSRKTFFIGDSMKAAFESSYGSSGDTLINCNLIDQPVPSGRELVVPGHVRVVFAGGLHLGRDSSIVSFATLMSEACSQVGISYTIDLYSGQNISAAMLSRFESSGIHYRGSVSWDDLQIELKKADFLLHVESFAEKYSDKTKYSLSTKLPEYLSSGVCVIGFGPESVASIRLLRDHKIGLALSGDATDVGVLSEAIQETFIRSSFGEKGVSFARAHFSPELIKKKLYDSLQEV
ncbi:hypothetical protein P0F76_19390 [Pseudomonas paraeruginosa]|uniref:hypothetical protein n=1 Tax=Pseudomonas paraeruginosa TaxID=2994495 RepID=UPI0024DED405|nr:hypothetical protein [Pseudomonas paraeruginosa]MDK2351316.1 hypothetical protein [Pseudomonas paraeruginosa]MEA8483533.1 hypothetical protein [Pseudomonas aeruginosa]